MLIITRKPSEGIHIGRAIRITVLDIAESADESGMEVRIGVEAPKSVAVSRDDFTLESHLRRQRKREEDGQKKGAKS